MSYEVIITGVKAIPEAFNQFMIFKQTYLLIFAQTLNSAINEAYYNLTSYLILKEFSIIRDEYYD